MEVKVSETLTVPPQIMEGMDLVKQKLMGMDKKDFMEEELYGPATHLINATGKLVRPGLVFTSSYVLGLDPKRFVNLAASIELLHTASLIHDDIVDRDRLRRGTDTVHAEYGIEKAILAGDALISKAIDLASSYGEIVVKRAAEVSMNMCAGEILDYDTQSKKMPLGLEAYLKVARLKTASLIAVSTSVVADFLGSSMRDTLYEYGLKLGYAFQIRDDVMNFLGIADRSRKETRTDTVNARPNLVSVLMPRYELGAAMEAIKINNQYLESAKELLAGMPNSAYLVEYADYLKLEV
jgi:geranylgeranyl pyrophosphate synthase